MKRYGEMDVANQLLNTARQQAASYGPFERNPQKMLGDVRANAESAVEREVAGVAGAANRVVDRAAGRVNGAVNKVQGAVREEAGDVADAMREVQRLMAKAQALEAERDDSRRHGPWLVFSGMAFQLAIVLLSAAILSVNQSLYRGSLVVGALAAALMGQGIWLWLPI